MRTSKWFYVWLLLVASTTAVRADLPLVSGQVVLNGDVTRYVYTITNVLSSGQIYGFWNMILPDGTLPIGHSEPLGWTYWFQKAGNTPWGTFFWESSTQSRIQPGQSAVFEVYTSLPVVTQWTSDWTVGIEPVEGRHYNYSDGTPLPVPVPVPEPSSILALAAGLGALGLWRRRR